MVHIGIIAAAALVVTFTNSLGAIASRADSTLAARTKVADVQKDDRAELQRLENAFAGLGGFTPTDEDAVAAAKRAADTATSNRTAECDKRGSNCRARELDEQAAASRLATVTTAKATTDRAKQLEVEIRSVRAHLNAGEPISNPNPLGNALALLLGAGAAALTAWQQAVVAAVFELCLVGVMVIYELLGHRQYPARDLTDGAEEGLGTRDEEQVVLTTIPPPVSAAPARRKAVAVNTKSNGSLNTYVAEQVFPADGGRVEMKALMQDYRAWCAQKGLMPMDLNRFLDEIEKLCRRLSIKIEVGDDRRVYCLDVKLSASAEGTALH